MVNILHFCITWVIFQQFSRRGVKLVLYFIIFHLLNYTSPLIPNFMVKWNKAYYELELTPKNEFSLFMATYRFSLCRYCRLWSLFVSSQLKNRFFEAKHLCQRIKYGFAASISFWWIQKLQGNERNQVPLFYRNNACNLQSDTLSLERISSKKIQNLRNFASLQK